MNRIYRSIWNENTSTFVAAAENINSRGRKSSLSAGAVTCGAQFSLKGLVLSLMLAFGSSVYAAPTGGVVSAGSASIASGARKTTINQASQNVAINWQNFSIGQSEAVQFVQPNSSAVALNRVLGPDPSSILGSLTANGKVFLVNPNGILFGKGAQVNVSGLVASTLNITDSDFMAGRYNFAGTSNAALLNQGSINANGGYVALLGAKLSNEGVISARLGTVALAAGNAVTLDVAGDGLLNVTVSQGVANALVQNGALIQADGGQVLLTAQAAGNLLQSAVNNTGLVQARTVEKHNGTIRLLADAQSGTVILSGTLDASGRGAGQTGGSVSITGHHVGLFDQGKIDVSGDAGGGSVLIGGDYQGKNPNIQNASATYMSADSTITADAITNGSGGKVVLWANDATRAYGSITARGGAQGGDGGLIESSGHWLDVAGINVNASAPSGKAGTWLLDPNNIIINAAGPDTNVTASPNFTSTNDNAIVTTGSIQTALNAGTSVTVTTGTGGTNTQLGDITVAGTISYDATAATTLTLNATHDVIVNAAITATKGNFTATAGHDVTVNAATKATTGNLTFTAVGNVNLAAATTITTGTLTAVAGGNVNVSAASTITTGDMIFRGDNDGTGPGAAAGTVAITCGANCLTITKGNLSIRFNPVGYATTAAEITAYDANLTGAGVLDAKAWVFGKGDNKLYDGTTTATVSGLKPDLGGVAPAAALGTVTNANFDTKNVGTSKLITYNSTFANATYDLFAPFGTTAGTYTTRADITVRPLTVNAVSDTRVYNGTTSSVGVPTSSGLQTGDTLNGPLTQAYASRNVMGTLGSTLIATGPYTVTDGNGGNNYTVTVNTAAGTITPATLVGSITAVNKVYDGNNSATILTRTLATPIAGDTVSYTGGTALFSDKNVANGKTVTGTGLSLAGADAGNYTVNSTATTTADITPAPLSIMANSVSKTYGGTVSFTGTEFSSIGLKNGETVGSVSLTSAGAVATAAVAGSLYEIAPSTATGGSFNASNYTISYVHGELGVIPAPLGIAANSATRLYGDANPAFSATYTGFKNGETAAALTGALALATPAVANSNVGNYTITPSGQSSTNYTISYVNGTLGVTPAPLGIVASSTSKPYGNTVSFTGTEFSSTGLKNGETIGSASLASAGAVATASVAGSPYAITPSNATGGTFAPSNYAISYVNGVLGVIPAPLGIAANSTSKTFGSTVNFTGTEFSSTGLKNGETVGSVSLASAGAAAAAGVAGSPYAITPSSATGGSFNAGNYTISYVDGTLGVIPAGLLGIAANSAAKIYNGLAYSGGNGVSYTGFQGGDTPASLSGTLAYGGSSQGAINVGNYAIVPSGQSSPNYTITYVSGNLSVIPAPLGIAANSATRLYGGANPAFSATYTGLQNGETAAALTGALALTTPAVANSNVGNYAITPSGQSSTNYTVSYVNGVLGVTPAPLGIAANSATRLYGDANPAFSASYTGFKNGDTAAALTGALALASPAVATSNVGNFAITPSGQSSTNYTISYVNGILGVTPAPLGIVATSTGKTYGNTVSFSGTEFSSTGLKNSETIGSVSLASAGAVATASVSGGPYEIAPSVATGGTFKPSNYAISYINGELGVIPAPLGIVANSIGKTYGSTMIFSGTEFSSTGLKNGETVGSVSLASAGAAAAAGVAGSPYGITASAATGGSFNAGNYTIGYTNGVLTVNPAALTVAGNADTKTYDGLAYNGGKGVAYSGFVNGETAAVLGGALAYGGSSQGAVNAGGYLIIPSGLTGSNYTISYANGALTVNPAALTVAGNADAKTYDGLAYNGGKGVAYSGFVNGETAAVLGGALAYGGTSQGAIKAGNYLITPKGLTSGNYAIGYTNGTLAVNPAPLTVNATGTNKVYDGSTVDAVTLADNRILGDVLTITNAAANFVDKNVDNGKAVNVSGISVTGTDAGNYTFNTTTTTTADITPASLTVAANDIAKTAGTPNPAFSATYSGLVTGDTPSALTGLLAFSTPATNLSAIGAYPIIPSGQSAVNYTITYANGTLAIIPVAVAPVVVPPVVVLPLAVPPVAQVPVVEALVVLPPLVVAPAAEALVVVPLAAEASVVVPPVVMPDQTQPVQDFGDSTSGGMAGLNLTVIGAGVRMPPIQAAYTPPLPTPALEAPVVVPSVTPPPAVNVPSGRPAKPNRN